MRQLGGVAKYFESGSFDDFARQQRTAVQDRLRAMPHDRVLSIPEEDLVEAVVSEFQLAPPEADFDAVRIEPTEKRYSYEDRLFESVFSAAGMHLSIQVPLRGDASLLSYHPSQSRVYQFTATVRDGALWLSEDIRSIPDDPDKAAKAVRRAVEEAIKPWREQLAYLRTDIERFNASLLVVVRTVVERRRKEALAYKGMREAIDIPLVAKPSLEPVVLAPKRIHLPSVSEPYEEEPRLEARYYEQLLDRIRASARNMERDPRAFGQLGEEQLRSIILTNLNTQFGTEGKATAETFNVEGKTDILLRHQDHNLFVAECKIYSGPAAIGPAVDQLLSYLAWRDSRAALILFVTRRDFTATMATAVKAATEHSSFKRAGRAPDNEARLVFGLPGDPLREVEVAVIGVSLPRPTTRHTKEPGPAESA